jgi:drug/metabolite transporter (DMT)-like permease
MSAIDKRKVGGTSLPANLIFVLIAGVFAMASSSIFIRYAQAEGVSSIVIGGARLVIASLLLTPFVVSRYWQNVKALSRTDLLWGVASGFCLAVHFAAWISSLEYTSVLVSTVIVTASPIWVAILEFTFLRTRPNRLTLVGLVIAIASGILIALASSTGAETTTEGSGQLTGIILAVIGSVAVASYFVLGRKLRAQLPVIPYIWLVYGCGGIFMTFVILVSGLQVVGFSANAYLWLLCCAIFPQLIGHSSLNYAVGYLPATFVSMITQLEPIGSAVLAFFLFAELPAPLQIVGSALLLFGVMIASLGQSQPTRKNDE